MESIYTVFVCERSKCRKETILITEQVEDTLKKGGYVSCSHCGCKNVTPIGATDDLRKCMDHAAYKRTHGAIRQVRSG
ncbi:hypothetical protein [Clostridium butyricum]|jgi:DNA-directed RNA polymerase subunit RPC12/RpoP|uniref:hypothetical protein n=1 Tax=Clostridium butyricum TaxID=1492 RepID=UPI00374E43B7